MKRACNLLTPKTMNISQLCEFHTTIKKQIILRMKKLITLLFVLLLSVSLLKAQRTFVPVDPVFPVRGFSIGIPSPENVDKFVKFIDEELAPAHFNTLILLISYNYDYKSHPELKDNNPLTLENAKKIKAICEKHNIEIIPQINMLGHQSWHFSTGNLLRVYPEFDETPYVKMDSARIGETYKWPNDEKLYCKSYCPLHPDVHKIMFDLIDEIMDVFDAKTFHAGMDEVFYIAEDRCPRCAGHDKAELFAGEVIKIKNHLEKKDRKMMIWGDRLIDGKTSGLGVWEASMNQTYRAIDMIPKDVIICDWHYDRAEPTAAYFAIKGFNVVSCPWNKAFVGKQQIEDMQNLRQKSNRRQASRYQGVIQTIWMGCDGFIKSYYDPETYTKEVADAVCTKTIMEEFKKMMK